MFHDFSGCTGYTPEPIPSDSDDAPKLCKPYALVVHSVCRPAEKYHTLWELDNAWPELILSHRLSQ